MSRHTLPPREPEHHGYEIVVGWDSTLANFFGEVRRPKDRPDDLGGEIVVSVARFRATATYQNLQKELHDVMKAISDYADIDGDLQKTLWDDSRREGFGIRG
jgi:hypothetical protein